LIHTLRSLNLNDNKLKCLPDLKSVKIYKCKNPDLKYSGFINFRSLKIHGNKLTNFPKFILKLKRLTHLNIEDNHIKVIPNILAKIPRIRSFNFHSFGNPFLCQMTESWLVKYQMNRYKSMKCKTSTTEMTFSSMRSDAPVSQDVGAESSWNVISTKINTFDDIGFTAKEFKAASKANRLMLSKEIYLLFGFVSALFCDSHHQ